MVCSEKCMLNNVETNVSSLRFFPFTSSAGNVAWIHRDSGSVCCFYTILTTFQSAVSYFRPTSRGHVRCCSSDWNMHERWCFVCRELPQSSPQHDSHKHGTEQLCHREQFEPVHHPLRHGRRVQRHSTMSVLGARSHYSPTVGVLPQCGHPGGVLSTGRHQRCEAICKQNPQL